MTWGFESLAFVEWETPPHPPNQSKLPRREKLSIFVCVQEAYGAKAILSMIKMSYSGFLILVRMITGFAFQLPVCWHVYVTPASECPKSLTLTSHL